MGEKKRITIIIIIIISEFILCIARTNAQSVWKKQMN